MTLQVLKEYYPYAVVNTITTAIGGENSEQGCVRFAVDVLTHRPDVVFINQGNHPNEEGHHVVCNLIVQWFLNDTF